MTMTRKQPHFSSLRMDWKTPKAVYQVLDAGFGFDFDPCPPKPTFDGLAINWEGVNYVNPPYGRELPKWIKKGYEEWQKGKTVVFLIPSRTDTSWWHDYCMKATEIRYIRGRLKFDDQPNPAPFPSAIVIFRKEDNEARQNYLSYAVYGRAQQYDRVFYGSGRHEDYLVREEEN